MSTEIVQREEQQLAPYQAYLRDMDIERFMMWLPDHQRNQRDANRVALEIQQAIQTLAANTRKFNPRRSSLTLALVTCMYKGLSLAKSAGECALLAFKSKQYEGYHDVVLVTMVGGYRELLARMFRLLDLNVRVVLQGDQWWWEEDENGLHYKFRAGARNERHAIMGATGINYANILDGFARITFADREPLVAVVEHQRLVELLESNQNHQRLPNMADWKRKNNVWIQHPTAMVQKTILKEVIRKNLHVTGRHHGFLQADAGYETGNRAMLRDALVEHAPNLEEAEKIEDLCEEGAIAHEERSGLRDLMEASDGE